MFHVNQILNLLLLLIAIPCQSQKPLVFQRVALPKPAMNDRTVLAWNEHQKEYANLTQNEQEFYYWVNYSREKPQDFYENAVLPVIKVYPQLVSENLKSLGEDLKNASSLVFFRLNDTLLQMSTAHAKDITSSNANPSHNSTNGEEFSDRFKKNGLKNCGGENISYGGGDTDPLFMLIMLYLDINVPELGHRKALLNPAFVNTGISIRKYASGNTFLVEDFACGQN